MPTPSPDRSEPSPNRSPIAERRPPQERQTEQTGTVQRFLPQEPRKNPNLGENYTLSSRRYGPKVDLGGGLDPLPIDLAESYPKAHFFDVDMANMSLKEEINQKIGGPDVSFLTANLADIPSLTEILSNAGWDSDAPTLLVSEGISYYIPKEVYRHTLTSLQTSGGCLVFEYSVPDHILVGVPKAEIVFDFFERFTALLNMPIQMQRYDDPEVRDLAAGMNGEVVDILTQHQLEFSRTGRNEMRDDPRMGAIRIALIHLH